MDRARIEVTRRAALGGGLGLLAAGPAGAATARPNGAAGLTCTAAGLAGLVFAGEDGATLSPALRWHIGSNTKAMTAMLYARCVDVGRCRWDATVPELFPDVPTDPAWATIRVGELMGHAAGLTDAAIDGAWLVAHHRDVSPPREQRRRFVAALLAAPPAGPRGAYRYGNANYVVLGAAVEQALDADWQDAMRGLVFAPLGMDGAGFGAPPRDGLWGRTGIGAAERPVDPAGIADNPAVLWPSGGVHLTPGDYARFLATILRGGAPILRAKTLDRLLTPAVPDARYAGGWSLEGPTAAPATILAHTGSNTFWFASARVDRSADLAAAALVNRGGEQGAVDADRLLRRLMTGTGG